jgi:hypothetical protein
MTGASFLSRGTGEGETGLGASGYLVTSGLAGSNGISLCGFGLIGVARADLVGGSWSHWPQRVRSTASVRRERVCWDTIRVVVWFSQRGRDSVSVWGITLEQGIGPHGPEVC